MNPSMKAIVLTLTMLDIYMCYTHHDFFHLINLLQAQRKKQLASKKVQIYIVFKRLETP